MLKCLKRLVRASSLKGKRFFFKKRKKNWLLNVVKISRAISIILIGTLPRIFPLTTWTRKSERQARS